MSFCVGDISGNHKFELNDFCMKAFWPKNITEICLKRKSEKKKLNRKVFNYIHEGRWSSPKKKFYNEFRVLLSDNLFYEKKNN